MPRLPTRVAAAERRCCGAAPAAQSPGLPSISLCLTTCTSSLAAAMTVKIKQPVIAEVEPCMQKGLGSPERQGWVFVAVGEFGSGLGSCGSHRIRVHRACTWSSALGLAPCWCMASKRGSVADPIPPPALFFLPAPRSLGSSPVSHSGPSSLSSQRPRRP